MERKVRCIAIDDEPLALEVIEKFCCRMGGIELHTYSDPDEGMAAIKQSPPDIAFLDIEMADVSGLDIAAKLPAGTCFIFTTAYLDYALEGFNLDAVDYLHKPFAYSRFEIAFAKALRRIEHSRQDASVTAVPRSIVLKQEYNNVTIPLDDILYVEAMEGYSKIFRESGGCIVSRIILKNVGSMLPEGEFVRIHRSYIVSRNKIHSFNRSAVRLLTGTVLPVGRQYASGIIALLS